MHGLGLSTGGICSGRDLHLHRMGHQGYGGSCRCRLLYHSRRDYQHAQSNKACLGRWMHILACRPAACVTPSQINDRREFCCAGIKPKGAEPGCHAQVLAGLAANAAGQGRHAAEGAGVHGGRVHDPRRPAGALAELHR